MEPITLNDSNFESTIKDGYTLIDFWAPWCHPCKMVAPIVEQLAKEWEGKIKVAKLNTDDFGDIAMQFGITGIPTMILFKDGQIVDKFVGAGPKPIYDDFLNRNYIASNE